MTNPTTLSARISSKAQLSSLGPTPKPVNITLRMLHRKLTQQAPTADDQEIVCVQLLINFISNESFLNRKPAAALKAMLLDDIDEVIKHFFGKEKHRHLMRPDPSISISDNLTHHLEYYLAALRELKAQYVNINRAATLQPFWLKSFVLQQQSIIGTPSKSSKYLPYFSRDTERGTVVAQTSPSEKSIPLTANAAAEIRALNFESQLETLVVKHTAQTDHGIHNIHGIFYSFAGALSTEGVVLQLNQGKKQITVTKITEHRAEISLRATIENCCIRDIAQGIENYRVAEDKEQLLNVWVVLSIKSTDNGRTYSGKIASFDYCAYDPLLAEKIASVNQQTTTASNESKPKPRAVRRLTFDDPKPPIAAKSSASPTDDNDPEGDFPTSPARPIP